MNRETVAAVVVTFNRKQLLTECLDALLAQGRPVDRIFVIDNASSDGTPELLEERGYLESPSIYYISLPENVGGAGGFYEGMKRGYDAGFDWLWVMDDDGRPTQNALDVLLNSSELQGTRNRAPLVVSDLDNLTLTFGVHYRGGIVKSIDEISDTTVEDANYFLGNLFHRSIIERAGYPKKEMFIWGDETEFRLRLERHNFFPVSSVNAIFYHPSNQKISEKILFGIFGHRMIASRLRLYCYHRNMAFIKREYGGVLPSIRFLLSQPLKYFVSGNWSEGKLVALAVVHGTFSIWGHEKTLR